MAAISTALQVLGFIELPEDEVPPEKIWHHDERMTEWFQAVKERREARSKGQEPIPDVEADMTENEIVQEVVGG